MGLGTSLFLIAAGAVLRWAVTATTSGINLHTLGLILLIVGGIGLVISLFWMTWAADRRRSDVYPDGRYPDGRPGGGGYPEARV